MERHDSTFYCIMAPNIHPHFTEETIEAVWPQPTAVGMKAKTYKQGIALGMLVFCIMAIDGASSPVANLL